MFYISKIGVAKEQAASYYIANITCITNYIVNDRQAIHHKEAEYLYKSFTSSLNGKIATQQYKYYYAYMKRDINSCKEGIAL